jgi:polyribonucleotide nucleotidyltransferase
VWQLARQLYRGAGGDRLPRPAAAAAEAALRALHTAPSTWSLGAAPADALPDERLLRDDAEDAARSEVDVELDDSSEAAAAAAASAAGLPPPLPGVVRRAFSFQGQDWTLETGRLARLADGACTLRCGGTTVLAAVTCDAGGQPQRRPGAGGAPLQVDYREKLYAVGRIPGTYNKREGAPKEHELLAARRMERAVRALLPRGFAHPLDLDAAVLSADGGGDPEVLALNAASAALAASDVPWGGPFGAVRVALTAGGGLVVNPPPGTHHDAPLRLLVAATAERVVLLEVEGEEAAESEVVRAMRAGVAAARELLAPQLSLAEGTGRTPRQVALAGADPAAARRMAALARAAAARILRNPELDSVARGRALAAAKASLADAMRAAGAWRAEFSRIPGSGCVTGSDVDAAFGAAAAAEARAMAVDDGLRPDGRGPIDLRPLRAEAGHVPVVHGSALFEAGDTQALAALTVGSRAEQQRVESLLGGDASKRLFVHYSLPDYATPGRERGWPPGGSMRHDLDRSAFVERALVGALPPAADFPFTLRLNADALGADGGAAAAAVCAGSLAMAAAGVPSRGMVAAVSVGLASEGGAWSGEAGAAGGGPPGAAHAWPPLGRHELLTDPTAAEVAAGDMEFRVAGTAAGVTAAQLDACAPGGVPLEVLEAALGRAHVARLRVLAAMRQALPEVRIHT